MRANLAYMDSPAERRSSRKQFEAFVSQRLRALRKENTAKLPLSARILRYFFLISIAVAAAFTVLDIVSYLASLSVESRSSHESLLQLLLTVYLLVAGIPLLIYCENTSVAHLSGSSRAKVNALLHLGALMFLASGILLRMEYFLSFLAIGMASLFVIRYARVWSHHRA